MIELIILNHLNSKIEESVHLEKPSAQTGSYVVFQKTSSSKSNHLPSAKIAFQSYSESLYNAVELNGRVKEAVESLIELNEIRGLTLNGDYNFTDTATKEYRYQAVYDIRYY